MTLRTTTKHKQALLDKLDDQYSDIVTIALSNLEKSRPRVSGSILHGYLDEWNDALADKEQLRHLMCNVDCYLRK